MNTYGINFIADNETINMKAEYYDLSSGFINLYKDLELGLGIEVFASYAADNVRWIVLQEEFTEKEIIKQIKEESE
jgi:hypothetical protein